MDRTRPPAQRHPSDVHSAPFVLHISQLGDTLARKTNYIYTQFGRLECATGGLGGDVVVFHHKE
eukprot:5653726-Pyramimonas_sp.AAC.1